jgi:hypothetical protein
MTIFTCIFFIATLYSAGELVLSWYKHVTCLRLGSKTPCPQCATYTYVSFWWLDCGIGLSTIKHTSWRCRTVAKLTCWCDGDRERSFVCHRDAMITLCFLLRSLPAGLQRLLVGIFVAVLYSVLNQYFPISTLTSDEFAVSWWWLVQL